MKKPSMLVAAFALSIPAPLALPTAAIAASNASTLPFCEHAVANGPITVSQCVALQNSNGHANGVVAAACSYAENNYPDIFDEYYDSYDQCVQDGAYTLIVGQQGGSGF